MKGHTAAVVSNMAKLISKSSSGLTAIIKASLQTNPIIDAREAYSARINITNTEVREKESCKNFSLRLKSAYCAFTELRSSVVLPSIRTELLGFQILKGARLVLNGEFTVLKNAMIDKKESEANKATCIVKSSFDSNLQTLT